MFCIAALQVAVSILFHIRWRITCLYSCQLGTRTRVTEKWCNHLNCCVVGKTWNALKLSVPLNSPAEVIFFWTRRSHYFCALHSVNPCHPTHRSYWNILGNCQWLTSEMVMWVLPWRHIQLHIKLEQATKSVNACLDISCLFAPFHHSC